MDRNLNRPVDIKKTTKTIKKRKKESVTCLLVSKQKKYIKKNIRFVFCYWILCVLTSSIGSNNFSYPPSPGSPMIKSEFKSNV